MPFNKPTLSELTSRIEGDIITRVNDDVPLLRRSLLKVLTRVWAGAVHTIYGNLQYITRQVFPDTADAENLEKLAGIWAIARKPASYASGIVTFTGTGGTGIPFGSVLRRSDDTAYTTTLATFVEGGGSVDVPIEALTPGIVGNNVAGTELVLESPIANINSVATVGTAGITNGTDTETDSALRQRLLDRIQQPPSGGSEADISGGPKRLPA